MNTKGIKFLAVLAVMAMAFAAVVVLAPADNDVSAVNVYGFADAQKDPVVIDTALTDSTTGYNEFYISDDATIKVTGLSRDIAIYVQNGKEIELNIKSSANLDKTITIKTVTGDQKRVTTSTVDSVEGTYTGKIVLDKTEVTFKGQKGQSLIYTAMMPYSVNSHTTSDVGGYSLITNVSTYKQFAVISSDTDMLASDLTIEEKVEIAAGQFIEVKGEVPETVKVVFGVKTTDVSESGTTTTFYATGADAGTMEFDNASDAVEIVNGSIAMTKDNSSVKASSVKGVTVTLVDGKFSIAKHSSSTSKGMTAGTLTVSGGTIAFNAFKIDTKATVTVSNNTVLSGAIEDNGTLVLRNDKAGVVGLTLTGSGTVVAQNEKIWKYTGVDPWIEFAGTTIDNLGGFNGFIDVSAITKKADVREAFSTASISRNQTFIVVDDTVVTTSLTVNGVLIINEGVTLTITKTDVVGAAVTLLGQYGQIINNGEILIKTTKAAGEASSANRSGLQVNGGYFENNGRILANSDSTIVEDGRATFAVNISSNKGAGFVNNGVISTSAKDVVSLDKWFTNAKTGSVAFNGTVSTTNALVNEGVISINNAKINSNLEIEMKKKATFNLVAAEITAGTHIKVSIDASNYVMVAATSTTATDKLTVRNLNVTNTSTDYSTQLDLSGTIGTSKPGTAANAYATLTMTGGVAVTTTAIVGEGFTLNLDNAKIDVPGSFTISKRGTLPEAATADSKDGLKMTVTGTVTDIANRLALTGNYVAAKYTLPNETGTTIYTTLESAVPAAVEANVNTIDVGFIPAEGTTPAKYPTVAGDISVPGGLFISGTGLNVGDDDYEPLITIATSAGFNFENVYLKNGMIAAANVNDINEGSIHADVVEVSDSYSGVFMSLDVALSIAMPGDVVELSQDFERVSKDLVIPEGVIVNATTADHNDKFVAIIDSNLVVNGTLIVDEFWFVATTDDTKSITVNGTIMDRHENGSCFTDNWYTPDGVSYKLTLLDDTGGEETWYVLTNIANLQTAVDIADDAKVNIEGSPKLGDITIIGDEDQPAEVTFKGNVDAGTITISNVTIKALDGKKVNATIADAVGSITITGAYVDRALSIYSMDDAGVWMEGAVTDGSAGTYGILFNGITGMNGTTRSAILWGNCEDEDPAILFNGETKVIGKKAKISDKNDVQGDGMTTITGLLYVDNGCKLTVNSDIQVLGGLVAADRTGEDVAGAIDTTGDIFVGITESELYDPESAIAAYKDDKQYAGWTVVAGAVYGDTLMRAPQQPVQADAIISGKISIVDGKFITVLSGSMVDPAIVEDLASMSIYIEDVEWLTVYGYDTVTSKYSMDGLKAPIVNAKVSSIFDEDGNAVAKFNHDYKVIYGSEAKKLSDFGNVFIALDYDAFKVTIKTDGSVKAVYIDGILMYTGQNENVFILDKIATGTHKVTVEPAAGYAADGCKLYTDMGTILPNMTFTFTEYDCVFEEGVNTYNVVYNINGTEIEPEPVPPTPEEESQWTITTILLVILVVLIAIMAVIVALRLNRS